MSKGSSHLFPGTSGAGRALIEEVIANGEKISPEKVVMITRDPKGKIVWLETGTDRSGLKHIIDAHGNDFKSKGISNENIPDYVLEAVYQGKIVGTQGKRDPRTIYEFKYNGVVQRIGVQVSENGYIVGANPKSMKG